MGNDKRRSHANFLNNNNKGYSAVSPNKKVRKEKKNDSNILKVEGVVIESNGNNNYKVELTNGVTIRAVLSGKMKLNNVRVIVGDKVDIELSAYDLTLGRITYRHKV